MTNENSAPKLTDLEKKVASAFSLDASMDEFWMNLSAFIDKLSSFRFKRAPKLPIFVLLKFNHAQSEVVKH